MDSEDLKQFLVIAHFNNLQRASVELNKTAGALSKIIKRIENKLDTQLFDRKGRNIQLNQYGERFKQYALHIVHESDQIISEFGNKNNKVKVNITGPSVLVQYWLPKMLNKLAPDKYDLNLQIEWEGEALNKVENGFMDIALATKFSFNEGSETKGLSSISLGDISFKVVAQQDHALFKKYPNGKLTSKALNEFTFACPSVSPFCGIKRGEGSDGWQDAQYPRTIGFRCNDFSVLMSLVKQNLALAYVPDFIAEQYNLREVDITDYTHINTEQVALFYKPSLASGWLNQFIEQI
ncbi:LysR family transcriptional regulator [Pseudoalteromonas sp. C2R02]|uniref:LysR family transcriptional regulator n=1 Tax=Pseudoalteromonas sp. C2R02 TaxID=2841565 RepID=UPI001C09045C|nr:LysR family transcriptional regulator [Pseudoalteromonas sp. C2R02]MBU2968283.1 LysR family transcriptional regulator [Pseudoalteromonas sp. C2R02]